MTQTLLLAVLFLAAGLAAVPLATRFGLGSVLGYLIAGIALSPILAALHVDVEAIQHFAEFGVVMMLFLVGLELEPKRLWEMRMQLLGLGGLQVVLTAAAVMGLAMLLGLAWNLALATGLILALSSTAIVLQTLNEKGLMKSDGGRASFSVLLTQDIAVIPMLALMPLLAFGVHAGAEAGDHGAADAGHGAGLSLVEGLPGWGAALVTLGAIAAVVVGGAVLTGPLFRFIALARLRELFIAAALLIVTGIALLMSLVGLSPALGTFLAGVVLANSEYRHELEADIDPFRGMLLGLFFMTVGAGIDFLLMWDNLLPILGLTVGLMALKAAVLGVLGLAFRLRGADRWLFALGLAQAGEFGFVLLALTVGAGVLPDALADRLLLVVALSMLLTPLLFILYDRVLAPMYAGGRREADEIDETGDVLILGHGRFGGIVNRMLRLNGYRTVVVDYSAQQLEMLRQFGLKVYFGDATRPDLLEAAGIARARLLIIAIDGVDETTRIVEHVTKAYPDLHVIARARNRHHVYELWYAGCRDIIRETYDSSIRAGRSALEALGHKHEQAMARARAFEIKDRAAMVEVSDLYDPNVPAMENAPYVARVNQIMREWEAELTGATDTTEDQERLAADFRGG
ncbi:cation:proton antiporter domain-containing protein [Wenxinia marina]|uniref:Kef-type potassium/proton antiporter, CPA2 family n=1 Tax=Wenxinia marina DSM 24838 TaxID=1123501 RepID=A0A0D0NGF3_9RHOB|nr:cation:proton antiporter [Wenxinia marina]KIQ67410.1 Kef-type potassium/proton antiporter, CPA2 family [Wenxinia marina DSM 24838]GGL69716.1 potassium transporter [Wenxinia marina]